MKKKFSAVMAVMILGVASASAEITFTDDFERSATGPQYNESDPNYAGPKVGSYYTVATGAWNIADASSAGRIPNYVSASSYATNSIMYLNAMETRRDTGESFTLSADIWNGGYGETTCRQGLVFNFQDENNYYAFDYSVSSAGNGTARLLQYAGGVETVLEQATGLNLNVYTYYTLMVEGDADGVTATLKTTDGTELYTATNSSTTSVDGHAGFWRNSLASVAFDNFSLMATEPDPNPAATVITDDFERSTTGPQYFDTVPNAIGPYTIVSGAWNISNASSANRIPNFVTASSYAANSIMLANPLQTLRDGNNNYTLSADVWCGGYEGSSVCRQGLVFNFQDENNYYAFDYLVHSAGDGMARLLKYVDGVQTVLDQKDGLTLDQYTYYTMVVEGDADGISAILKTTGGAFLFSTGDPSTTFMDGYAGFWRNSIASVAFDNFSLAATVPPNPPTMDCIATNGFITITVGNLTDWVAVTNALQTRAGLISSTWTNLYSVTGVTETNWTLPANESQAFFRILTTY